MARQLRIQTQASRRFAQKQKKGKALARQIKQIIDELGLCTV